MSADTPVAPPNATDVKEAWRLTHNFVGQSGVLFQGVIALRDALAKVVGFEERALLLQKEVEDLASRKMALGNEVGAVQATLNELKAEYDAKFVALRESYIDKIEEAGKLFEREQKALQDEMSVLKGRLTKAKENLSTFEGHAGRQKIALDKQIGDFTSKLDSLKSTIAALNEQAQVAQVG